MKSIKCFLIFCILFFMFVFINYGLAQPQEIELNCVDNGDWGLVYNEPGGQPPYGTIKTYHATPPRPDLRLGYRDSRYHKSFFLFDISPIPNDAIIQEVRVQVGYQDASLSSQNTIIIQGISDYNTTSGLFSSLMHEYVGFFAEPLDHDFTWDDPQNDPIIPDLTSRIQNSLYIYFGIRLELGDMSVEDDYYETKMVRMWVTYNEPVSITVRTNPEVLQFTVDGHEYTGSHNFSWIAGEPHTVSTTSPQTYNNTEYTFQNWSDGGEIEHTITPTSNQTITANFEEVTTVHITVKNRHDDGYVKVDYDINHQQFPSGVGFDFDQGSTHDFEAWEQNYGGYDMVFKPGEEKWDTPDGPFYTALVENHAVQNPGTYWAQLWRICNFTADNHFLNGGSGGQIKVNGVVQQPAPYSSTTLEADQITFEAPPQQQTVNGKTVDYNFLNWGDGSTQNPRTLAPSTNFNVLAKYKGHLVSDTYEATSTNNGRRITYDAEGNLHCVYLDADNIWYTYSDDGGESWTPEELVDGAGTSPGVQCFNPSITVLNGKIYCIYTTFWDVEGFTYFELRYSYKTIGLANWTAVVLEYIYDSVNNKPNPVISAGYYNEDKYLIFTYTVVNEQTEEFEIHTQYKKNNDSFIHIEQAFPGTMPSTDNNKGISVTNFFLAYEYHGDIYTRFWDWSRKEWTEEACASSDLWMLTNTGQPSLSVQGDYGYLAFEGVTEANPTNCIYYRKIKYKSGTGFRFYDPYLISENSVHSTVSYNTTPVVTVFYQHDGQIYNKHNEEGVWHLGPYGPGRNPNVTVNGIARACWTKEETLPYLVVAAGDEVGGGGGSEDGGKDTLKVDKRLSFVFQNNKRNSYLALDIRNMSYNGKYIQFDSLLSSPLFSLSSAGGRLDFEVGYMIKNFTTGINPDEEIFRITLQNGLSAYPVRSFKLRDILNLQLTPGQTNTISINIPSLTASTGRFILSFANLKPNIIHLVGSPVSSVNNEMLVSQNINQTLTLPQEFFLEQNWPNPFNPNTNIRFTLPEESGVSLVIYDLSGRQIKTLTVSRYPAGSHQIQWDGRDDSGNAVASGIYVYRIHAGKYTQSRKMMLLK